MAPVVQPKWGAAWQELAGVARTGDDVALFVELPLLWSSAARSSEDNEVRSSNLSLPLPDFLRRRHLPFFSLCHHQLPSPP
uniref:Uncharacterized protein n=1 Tax=Oryza barthii TaxID=65489 RepID=A0A0D3GF71_9ORYZ